MINAPLPANEISRLEALRDYCILDTPAEAEFDEIAALAAQICETPIALISLVDEGRQWFKSKVGLDVDQTPRGLAFCAHALGGDELLHVPDASLDPRFADNPMVIGGPRIRFYAGAPLIASGGEAIGTLCVMDREARNLSEGQQFALRVLSRQVMARMELRREARELNQTKRTLLETMAEQGQAEQALRASETEYRQLAEKLTAAQAVGNVGSWETNVEGGEVTWSGQTHRIFETSPESYVPTHLGFLDFVHPDDRAALHEAVVNSLGLHAPCSVQHRIVMPDGRVKHLEQRWQIFLGEDDGSPRAIGTCQDITERMRAEEERDRLFNLSLDLLCVAGFDGRLLQVNPAWSRCLGWTTVELTSRPMADFIHPDDLAATVRTRESIMAGASVRGFENRYRCRDGSYRWFSWNVHPLPETRQVFAVARDITDQKLSDAKIHRLNRLYAVSSGINEAIIRLRKTQELYEQACRIAVERGGLVMAWVGLVGNDGELIKPVAHWGREEGYLELVRVATTPDQLAGKGPAGQAFRNGSPASCNDIAVDGGTFASRQEALERGYRSCAVFPLKVEGRVMGILAVYGDQPGYFGEEEMQLLNALAENLSFAVESQQREQRRLEAEAALHASEATMAAAQRISHFGSWERELNNRDDLEASPLRWSDEMFRIAGYDPGAVEVTHKLFLNLVHPEDREAIQSAFAGAIRGHRPFSTVHRLVRPDGEVRVLQQSAQIFFDETSGRPLRMIGNAHDITEQQRAEETLRESEQRFRQLAENINEVFWITEPATERILYISPGYAKIWGRSSESPYPTRQLWLETIQPEDRPRVARAMDEAPIRGEYDETFRIVRPDGEIRWIHDRAFPVRNDKGEIYRMVGTAKDITRRKVAEIALKASDERYRRLFQQNPQSMWVYDRETLRFLAVNDTAIEHYGHSRKEFLSLTIRDIHLPEDVPAMLAAVTGPDSSVTQPSVWRHQLKDGRVIQVEISSHALDFDGREARMVLAQDITERLAAENRIREQATLLDKAQDAIIVRDLDYRILFWNSSAERLYGWTAEEAVGRFVPDLLYRDTSAFLAAMDAMLATGEWVGEIEQVTRDGTTLLVEGRWTLVRDDDGNPKSVLAINTDITDRKKLEQQFLRAQRMESIGTLAGGIAHDLNNVLAPIMMSIDLLKMTVTDDRSLEILEMIGTSARRGAEMVSQVLSFARGMEGRRVTVRVDHLVLDLAKIIGETFPKNIRIDTDLGAGLLRLDADPTQLHQVLLNLCVNARDAMPDGGRIILRASNKLIDEHYASMNLGARAGEYISLEVEDTGSGMSSGLIDQIFDPFFTTKEVGKGTGLGLSTAMAIVKGHGGFIQVYSDPGSGSRFRVYLPGKDEAMPDPAPGREPDLPRGKGETVLVVDDEASIRQVTRQTLEAFGYQVRVAADGTEAVAIFVEHRDEIAVVLTDMMMPLMDGPSLIKVLRRLDPRIRIIGASGISANRLVAQSMHAGVKQFLPKPYTAETLLKALKKSLSGKDS